MVEKSTEMADRTKSAKKNEKKAKSEKMSAQRKEKQTGSVDTKGLSVSRSEDLGIWYSEMLTKAGIVSYYDVQDMCPLVFQLVLY